ncbi:MAG: CYTH domain-containing protein [candidate division Zixibacteria bacterium]|nr:CYTH domain-containing protein [candidate division Zixibacteria bacterium]
MVACLRTIRYNSFMPQQPNITREIEIKLDLASFTNYLKLLGFLGQIEHQENQQNSFFDTPDGKLAKAGWALRVRAEKKQGLVTIKSIPAKPGLAVIRQEIETVIPKRDAIDILNGQMDLMSLEIMPIDYIKNNFGVKQVEGLVKFDNLRQKKLFKIEDSNYMLEIDKTEFSDGSNDYELELELSDTGRIDDVEVALRRLFSQLDIPFVRQTESKFARALKKAGIH